MAKISVIVPVYNVEPYIHRCIDSILNQTFSDFELIIVESASTDKSGEICDSYAKKDKRITVIHESSRNGISAARNIGIDWAMKNSDSQWLAFIDSDDWLHKRFFEMLLNAASEKNAEVSSCFFEKVFDFDLTPNPVNKFNVKTGTAEQLRVHYDNYAKFNLTTVWGRIYRKELFSNIRFPVGLCREDEYVTYRVLFPCKKIAVVESVLYYYLKNPTGAMNSPLSVKELSDWFTAYEKQLEYYHANGSIPLFQLVFSTYTSMLTGFYYKYIADKNFKKELRKRNKKIYGIAKNHKACLPKSTNLKKLKRICRKLDREAVLSDYNAVKEQGGVVRSLFYLLKHFLFNKP